MEKKTWEQATDHTSLSFRSTERSHTPMYLLAYEKVIRLSLTYFSFCVHYALIMNHNDIKLTYAMTPSRAPGRVAPLPRKTNKIRKGNPMVT
jgi:hypothetical protein